MKNNIFILLLLISLSLSAQKKKFEGLWVTINPADSSWYLAITHHELEDSLTLTSYSFNSEAYIERKIVKQDDDTIFSNLKNKKTDWELDIKYTILHNDIMKAIWSGSHNKEVFYKKLIN